MQRAGIFLILSSLALICGCSESSSPTAPNADMVVGTWIDSDGDEWTFNADGTFFDYDGDEGTWSVDGNKFTWTYLGLVSVTFTFSVNDDELRLTLTVDGETETEVWQRKK